MTGRRGWAGRLLNWSAGDRKTAILCLAVTACCGLLWLVFLRIILDRQSMGIADRLGDFFPLWTYGKIAAAHPATDLYSFSRLHAEQVALGMPAADQKPFPYPPGALLVFVPLSLLPFAAAYLAWIAASFALYAWSVVATCWRSPAAFLLALLAPASIVNLDFGQSGFLSAALLIAGIRLSAARPLLAGCLLGLLTFKPTLGVLVPVALIAAGLWRTVLAAALATVALSGLATAVFGWAVWPAWLHMLPEYARWYAASQEALRQMPTIEANLRSLGLSLGGAQLLQWLVALVVAGLVWRLFRNGPSDLACAALLSGTLLCTPHALIYDTPMVTGAIALLIGSRLRADARFNPGEIVAMLLAAAFPLLPMLNGLRLPIGSFCLLLLFVAIAARGLFPGRASAVPSDACHLPNTRLGSHSVIAGQ